jgi:hypothetical protein
MRIKADQWARNLVSIMSVAIILFFQPFFNAQAGDAAKCSNVLNDIQKGLTCAALNMAAATKEVKGAVNEEETELNETILDMFYEGYVEEIKDKMQICSNEQFTEILSNSKCKENRFFSLAKWDSEHSIEKGSARNCNKEEQDDMREDLNILCEALNLPDASNFKEFKGELKKEFKNFALILFQKIPETTDANQTMDVNKEKMIKIRKILASYLGEKICAGKVANLVDDEADEYDEVTNKNAKHLSAFGSRLANIRKVKEDKLSVVPLIANRGGTAAAAKLNVPASSAASKLGGSNSSSTVSAGGGKTANTVGNATSSRIGGGVAPATAQPSTGANSSPLANGSEISKKEMDKLKEDITHEKKKEGNQEQQLRDVNNQIADVAKKSVVGGVVPSTVDGRFNPDTVTNPGDAINNSTASAKSDGGARDLAALEKTKRELETELKDTKSSLRNMQKIADQFKETPSKTPGGESTYVLNWPPKNLKTLWDYEKEERERKDTLAQRGGFAGKRENTRKGVSNNVPSFEVYADDLAEVCNSKTEEERLTCLVRDYVNRNPSVIKKGMWNLVIIDKGKLINLTLHGRDIAAKPKIVNIANPFKGLLVDHIAGTSAEEPTAAIEAKTQKKGAEEKQRDLKASLLHRLGQLFTY